MDTVNSNSEGHTCSDISVFRSYGYEDMCSDSYDTIEFTASESCVACGGGTVKKNYKIRVPSTFLKKNQKTLAKRKLKVRIPSKFLKKRAVVKKVNDTNTMVKKKLKVRIPSKFLKKVVKKKVKVSSKVFKKNLVKLRKKKKLAKESECPTSQKKSSSTLSAVKRLVRLKRKAKVHPITSTK